MKRICPLLIFFLLSGSACSRSCSTARTPAPTVDGLEAGENVISAYTSSDGPAHPLAARLCAALHGLVEERRAQCCNQNPAAELTAECTRTLSASLRTRAVIVTAADVARCEAAMKSAVDGCDWVGPRAPSPPAECDAVHGTLHVGRPCRSSLECERSLRCRGAGPTTVGTCAPAKEDGETCGASFDPLAAYTRADRLERSHPECVGYCDQHQCAPRVAAGGACTFDGACDHGQACVKGRCAKTVRAPPAVAGRPCPSGACAGGLRCVRGQCVTPKSAGGACDEDAECKGACLKSGVSGTCGMACDAR